MSQLLPSLQFLEALLTDVMLDPAGFLFRSGILHTCLDQPVFKIAVPIIDGLSRLTNLLS